MRFRAVVLAVMLLILASSAFAANGFLNSVRIAYEWEGGNLTDSTGNTTATNVGTTNITGHNSSSDARDFNTDAISLNDNLTGLTNWHTISFWIKNDGGGSGQEQILSASLNNGNGFYNYFYDPNDQLTSNFYSDDSGAKHCNGGIAGANLTAGTWFHIVWVRNITHLLLYRDKLLIATSACNTQENFTLDADIDDIHWGRHGDVGSEHFAGSIDDTYIFDKPFTQAQVNELYDLTYSGFDNGTTPPPAAPDPVYFDIFAYDNRTGSAINTFSATINGTEYNTTNGTLTTGILENSTQLWNISVYTYDGDYATRDFIDYNVSVDLNTSLYPFFKVTATDSYNSTSLTEFNATITGYGTYVSNSSTITTNISFNSSILLNITTSSGQYGGYRPNTTNNKNMSTNLAATMSKLYRLYNANISAHVAYSGINYVRNLTITYNYTCPSQYSATLNIYLNSTLADSVNATCDNGTETTTAYHQASSEGAYAVLLELNASHLPAQNNYNESEGNITYDLNNPSVASLSFTSSDGFIDPDTNVSLNCTDTISPILEYNLTFNGAGLFYGNLTTNTIQSNATSYTDGTNTATGVCTDFFGSASDTETETYYLKEFCLIDEVDKGAFNLDNCTSAKIYYDDNSSVFDFKSNGTTCVNFTSPSQEKLRVELTYDTGTYRTITRYIDVTLPEEETINVCANKEGVEHYEQLIISATEEAAVLRNIFAQCYIAADYTRFAYQEALVLKAYTIDSTYYLYTLEGTTQTFLASVDGGLESYINLNNLEFLQEAYNVDIIRESLTFDQTSNTSVTIRYINLAEDNEEIEVTIEYAFNDTQVFNTASISDDNNFTLVFDYSLLGVNDSTLFRITINGTTTAGTPILIKRYFYPTGTSGYVSAAFAFVIAILLLVFGLTFTITSTTLGWFGMIVELAAIGTLSMATQTWYTSLTMAVSFVLFVYTALMLVTRNTQEVA